MSYEYANELTPTAAHTIIPIPSNSFDKNININFFRISIIFQLISFLLNSFFIIIFISIL